MICVSTFRPHQKNAEYALNQSRAVASWNGIFDEVFLIGRPEPELTHPYVSFLTGEEYPRIKDMILPLTLSDGWGAWINCDIVLTSPIKQAMHRMDISQYTACTSQRFEYNPSYFPDLSQAQVPKGDYGLDIFITKGNVWLDMYHAICPDLRKGGMVYDTWMTGYLWKKFCWGFRSITNYRCVFHPKHEGRQKDFANSPQWIQDEYGAAARIPPELEMERPNNRPRSVERLGL